MGGVGEWGDVRDGVLSSVVDILGHQPDVDEDKVGCEVGLEGELVCEEAPARGERPSASCPLTRPARRKVAAHPIRFNASPASQLNQHTRHTQQRFFPRLTGPNKPRLQTHETRNGNARPSTLPLR